MNQPVADHKPDNLFGVCNALGEEFGFNPLWLRLALSVAFLFAPVVVICGYFAVGAAVLAARLIFPKPKSAAVISIRVEAVAQDHEEIEYARAA